MHEDDEQISLFEWVEVYRPLVPALAWFHHVPNGEKREKFLRYDRRTGQEYWFSPAGLKLTRMGVLAGIADLALDWPMPRDPDDPGPDGSGWYHGAKLEMKRVGGEKPAGQQLEYLLEMHRRGYFVACCYGAAQAWEALQDYLWVDMPLWGVRQVVARQGPMKRWRNEPAIAPVRRPPRERAAKLRT